MGKVWTNAPALDLEELVSRVGLSIDTCSEDAGLYTKEGEISLKQFRGACKGYPEKKAKGTDGWGPKELFSLPDFILLHLVALLRRCHLQMKWPQGFCLNFMSLLPKVEVDDFRTVAKTQ